MEEVEDQIMIMVLKDMIEEEMILEEGIQVEEMIDMEEIDMMIDVEKEEVEIEEEMIDMVVVIEIEEEMVMDMIDLEIEIIEEVEEGQMIEKIQINQYSYIKQKKVNHQMVFLPIQKFHKFQTKIIYPIFKLFSIKAD